MNETAQHLYQPKFFSEITNEVIKVKSDGDGGYTQVIIPHGRNQQFSRNGLGLFTTDRGNGYYYLVIRLENIGTDCIMLHNIKPESMEYRVMIHGLVVQFVNE